MGLIIQVDVLPTPQPFSAGHRARGQLPTDGSSERFFDAQPQFCLHVAYEPTEDHMQEAFLPLS